jgi:hypothetical protein
MRNGSVLKFLMSRSGIMHIPGHVNKDSGAM